MPKGNKLGHDRNPTGPERKALKAHQRISKIEERNKDKLDKSKKSMKSDPAVRKSLEASKEAYEMYKKTGDKKYYKEYQKQNRKRVEKEYQKQNRKRVEAAKKNYTKFNKGGMVKANCGASMKPNRMARK